VGIPCQQTYKRFASQGQDSPSGRRRRADFRRAASGTKPTSCRFALASVRSSLRCGTHTTRAVPSFRVLLSPSYKKNPVAPEGTTGFL
jgi:hypothetical protein